MWLATDSRLSPLIIYQQDPEEIKNNANKANNVFCDYQNEWQRHVSRTFPVLFLTKRSPILFFILSV